MSRPSKLLTQAVVDLSELSLKRLGRTGLVSIKLRAIISAHTHGISAVALVFGITKATLISWIKHVKEGSLDLLSVQKGRGPKSILKLSHKEKIKQRMLDDSQITIDKMKQRLLVEAGLDVSRSTVHRAMKSVDFSYITPRPRHYKQSPDALLEAKKKSSAAN